MQHCLPRTTLFAAILAATSLIVACKSSPDATDARPQATQPGLHESAALDRIEVTGDRLRRVEQAKRNASNAVARRSVAHAPASPPAPVQPRHAYAASDESELMGPAPSHNQPVNTEKYADHTDNPVHRPSEQPVSTFSIDVDTGSYSNVRRMLRQGVRPPADSVRAEEFINYFNYQHPALLAVTSRSGSPPNWPPRAWNERRQLLMIGIKGYDVPKAKLPASNLVFLLDTSGSMDSPDKLPLLKQAFTMLVPQLRAQDRVSIVVYAGSAGLVLPPTPGDRHEEILAALDRLQAGGSTNGGDGIQLAYAMARQSYLQDGVNRVILATDGDFNVGTVSQESLETLVGDQRKSGIALTTLGFGQGNYNDAMAERLADVGDGNHAYIDTPQEARKVLVEEMQSTLMTIARDVKIQIEFNPALVSEYRLIGYENRLLKREDFANDRIDAATSVPAMKSPRCTRSPRPGQARTACPHCATEPARPHRQAPVANSPIPAALQVARHASQPPAGHTGSLSSFTTRSSPSFRLASAVAAYADLLRGGAHVGSWTWNEVAAAAHAAGGDDRSVCGGSWGNWSAGPAS